LVDEDPSSAQPNYIGKLTLRSHEHDIKLLYDGKTKNHLIVLCPSLEKWILKAAQEAGVNVNDYDLPNEAKQLHKIINTKMKNLKNLIENIKKKSKMLKALQNFVRK
jgi:hypothetical protein